MTMSTQKHTFLPRGISENQVLSHSPVSLTFFPRAINDTEILPQNDCLSGVDVSHHPDNQVKPLEYHQCMQQSQGLELTSPHDLSVELNCCSGNRILVLHDSAGSHIVKTFPVLNDWLDDSRHQTKQCNRIRLIFCQVSEWESMCFGASMWIKLYWHVSSAHDCLCDVVKKLVFVRRLVFSKQWISQGAGLSTWLICAVGTQHMQILCQMS